jgi:hypothetical protein
MYQVDRIRLLLKIDIVISFPRSDSGRAFASGIRSFHVIGMWFPCLLSARELAEVYFCSRENKSKGDEGDEVDEELHFSLLLRMSVQLWPLVEITRSETSVAPLRIHLVSRPFPLWHTKLALWLLFEQRTAPPQLSSIGPESGRKLIPFVTLPIFDGRIWNIC